MPSQHKRPPISLRLPEGDRSWLMEFAKTVSRPVNAIVTEALAEYRKRHEVRDAEEGQ